MWDDPFLPNLSVIDNDKDTGLYHPQGGRIYKASQPIGFGRQPEKTYIIKKDTD